MLPKQQCIIQAKPCLHPHLSPEFFCNEQGDLLITAPEIFVSNTKDMPYFFENSSCFDFTPVSILKSFVVTRFVHVHFPVVR
jgi:hypothetical protein